MGSQQNKNNIIITLMSIWNFVLLGNSIIFILLFYLLNIRVYILLIDIFAFINIFIYFFFNEIEKRREKSQVLNFIYIISTFSLFIYVPIVIVIYYNLYYSKIL